MPCSGVTIKAFAQANPFAPFVVQLNDGRRFTVAHPDYVRVSPRGSRVIIYDHEEHETHVSGLLVASVEPLRNEKPRSS